MNGSARAATTSEESPVFFSNGTDTLFGVFTLPTGPALGTAAILLWGSGHLGSTGRNRIWVRLSRRLAACGFHSFRFDFHGVGDSTGAVERFRLDRPFVEDLEAAVRWVHSQGIERLMLVGWCFGARTVLGAPHLKGLQGVVLVSVPVREAPGGRRLDLSLWEVVRRGLHPQVIQGFLDPERRGLYLKFARRYWRAIKIRLSRRGGEADVVARMSQTVVDRIADLVERGVPILFIYGTADVEYADFLEARSGRLGTVLERAGALAEIVTLPGRVHEVGQIDLQDAVIEAVENWLPRQNRRNATPVS